MQRIGGFMSSLHNIRDYIYSLHAVFLSSADSFQNHFFRKIISGGSNSGTTFCRARPGSKLFAKGISRRH